MAPLRHQIKINNWLAESSIMYHCQIKPYSHRMSKKLLPLVICNNCRIYLCKWVLNKKAQTANAQCTTAFYNIPFTFNDDVTTPLCFVGWPLQSKSNGLCF